MEFISYGTDYNLMRVDDLNCINSNYLTVLQCTYSTYMDGVCTYGNSYDATVYCCERQPVIAYYYKYKL